MMGIPGRSNAFDISSRLGLNPAIVEGARRFQSQEEARTANLIKDLEAIRLYRSGSVRRRKACGLRLPIPGLGTEKGGGYQEAGGPELEKAREEALEIVSQARKESDRLLKEIREMQKLGAAALDQQAAQKAREKLKGQERKLYEKMEEALPPKAAPENLSREIWFICES